MISSSHFVSPFQGGQEARGAGDPGQAARRQGQAQGASGQRRQRRGAGPLQTESRERRPAGGDRELQGLQGAGE